MELLLLLILATATSYGYKFDSQEGSEPDLTVTHEAWFDIEIKDYDGPGEDYRGRIVIGLFGNTAPMTTLNFVKLANKAEVKIKGKKRQVSYKNTVFHRLVPDFIIQGGDVTSGDGKGGVSAFAKNFIDESFQISHKGAGYVSMANHGPDTNNSQFFILLNPARWLDNKHVAFGKVVRGMSVLFDMGEVPTHPNTKPKKTIKIIDCGAEELDEKYVLTDEEAISKEDIARKNKSDK